jgi:hypothetical protein
MHHLFLGLLWSGLVGFLTGRSRFVTIRPNQGGGKKIWDRQASASFFEKKEAKNFRSCGLWRRHIPSPSTP